MSQSEQEMLISDQSINKYPLHSSLHLKATLASTRWCSKRMDGMTRWRQSLCCHDVSYLRGWTMNEILWRHDRTIPASDKNTAALHCRGWERKTFMSRKIIIEKEGMKERSGANKRGKKVHFWRLRCVFPALITSVAMPTVSSDLEFMGRDQELSSGWLLLNV